jgi:hypothetical protein
MAHTCHARDCQRPVAPRFLMCPAHWRLVPRRLQQAVYAAYRPGQERDKEPSAAWHRAADLAIDAVAVAEGKPSRLPDPRLYDVLQG